MKAHPDVMTICKGWKITHVDGTTYGGFRWPLPMPGERVVVEATDVNESNVSACPDHEGDGLCAVRHGVVRHVSSGGVRLAQCIGLELEWDEVDELGRSLDNEKIRLRKVTVVGLFDPLALIRQGLVTDLRQVDLHNAYLYGACLPGANLIGANLRSANLFNADLSSANLSNADLYGAHLFNADLSGASLCNADLRLANLIQTDLRLADLSHANLHGADLTGADLRNADLFDADLTGADLYGADLPSNFDFQRRKL